MSRSATVCFTDVVLKVFGQQRSPVAQRNKRHQALETRVMLVSEVHSWFLVF